MHVNYAIRQYEQQRQFIDELYRLSDFVQHLNQLNQLNYELEQHNAMLNTAKTIT